MAPKAEYTAELLRSLDEATLLLIADEMRYRTCHTEDESRRLLRERDAFKHMMKQRLWPAAYEFATAACGVSKKELKNNPELKHKWNAIADDRHIVLCAEYCIKTGFKLRNWDRPSNTYADANADNRVKYKPLTPAEEDQKKHTPEVVTGVLALHNYAKLNPDDDNLELFLSAEALASSGFKDGDRYDRWWTPRRYVTLRVKK